MFKQKAELDVSKFTFPFFESTSHSGKHGCTLISWEQASKFPPRYALHKGKWMVNSKWSVKTLPINVEKESNESEEDNT